MKSGKNFKIYGMTYGIVGDLIMGLPLLNYFEKKYPGSYKYWTIQKKIAFVAPLYFNHPLIDKIEISSEWNHLGERDLEIASQCDIYVGDIHNPKNQHPTRKDWWNEHPVMEYRVMRHGYNYRDVLTEEEMKPKLYKWFTPGFETRQSSYSKKYVNEVDNNFFSNVISIFPFAQASPGSRCPSANWWKEVVQKLIKAGYNVHHFGHPNEQVILESPNYTCYTQLTFFDQIKLALASRLTIGTDSGSMWVIGAYQHPAIHLITNWLPNHHTNFLSLAPVNDNCVNMFEKGGCDRISTEDVLNNVIKGAKI